MTKFERIEHWLTNIFWFHYKWYWFFGIFAATFVVLLVADNIKSVDYDWKVAYYTENAGSADDEAAAVAEHFANLLPDRTGDKSVNVEVVIIDLGARKPGQELMYQVVSDGEAYIIAAPEDFLSSMRSLGYLVRLGDGSYWKRTRLNGTDYVFAVNDGIVELTNVEQGLAIGMSREQISEYDDRLLQQHKDKLQIAVETVDSLG